MTREALLKKSISEFEDNVNNAKYFEVERHYTLSGYCYIIKGKGKKLSCAIHYSSAFDTNENVGKYQDTSVNIATRIELPSDCVIEYKGMNIAISSIGSFNETMGQWHYAGSVAFKPIQDMFMITSEDEINEHIGSNSLEIFMALNLDYPLVPSYYAATSESSYIMADVTDSYGITPVIEREDGLYQYKKDNLKLSFVNITTKGALDQIYKIQEESLKSSSLFGINRYGTMRDENFYQMSFNWKSLVYSVEMEINYYLKIEETRTINTIKEAFFNAVEVI